MRMFKSYNIFTQVWNFHKRRWTHPLYLFHRWKDLQCTIFSLYRHFSLQTLDGLFCLVTFLSAANTCRTNSEQKNCGHMITGWFLGQWPKQTCKGQEQLEFIIVAHFWDGINQSQSLHLWNANLVNCHGISGNIWWKMLPG